MASSYVVDMQCFKTLQNEFIIKELCIVGVNSNFCYQCVVKPPIPFCSLCDEMKKRVNYITNYIHGIPWYVGYLSEDEVITILRNILKKAARVYIKGSERANYLSFLLNYKIPVIDLDIFDFKRRQLRENKNCKCHNIFNHKHLRLRCAVTKACTYRDWLETEMEMGGV